MRGSVFLRRTSLAAMPMPIKSSELKSSSASCCVSPISFRFPIVALNQVNRVVGAHNSFAEHCGIPPGATSVAACNCFKHHGRSRRSFRVEIDHHAAPVLLHHPHHHFLADLQFAANQFIFHEWPVVFPTRIKICTEPAMVERHSGFFGESVHRAHA